MLAFHNPWYSAGTEPAGTAKPAFAQNTLPTWPNSFKDKRFHKHLFDQLINSALFSVSGNLSFFITRFK